jgi:hypothetical protein
VLRWGLTKVSTSLNTRCYSAGTLVQGTKTNLLDIGRIGWEFPLDPYTHFF